MTREEAIYCLDHKDIVTPTEFWMAVGMAIRELKQPEIIRCEECTFWYGKFCTMHDMYTDPDDFCSYATRRYNNGT